MKAFCLWSLALGALVAGTPARAEDALDADILDLASGAVVVFNSSQFQQDPVVWPALSLLDGTTRTGWSSAKGASFPHRIIVELPGRFRIDSIAFDSRGTEESTNPGISARAIEVFAATEYVQTAFVPILKGELKQADRTSFTLDPPTEARWLMLDIQTNWGHGQYTELMELEASGQFIDRDQESRELTGVYDTNYGPMLLTQDKDRVSGCYYKGKGTLEGSTDGRVIRFEWRQTVGLPNGSAIAVVADTGPYLNGLWYEAGELKGTWFGPRAPEGTESGCAATDDNPVARDLSERGRAILYGIRFDLDSTALRPESEATLRRILDALKAAPSWRVAIEGHTDSTGGDAYNQRLSEGRAAAVTAWLAANGIDSARARAVGKGETQPVADNQTAQGRALNRRVEVSLEQ